MAEQTLKNPYNFDFLTLREKYDEKELEDALINQITQFLLELGTGFSYLLVADFPDTYSLIGQDEVSKTYSFPKSHISYHKPRAVSTEQRERARQMMTERNREKED
ncbi:MAG: DUF1016 domain-containing protein [Lachnospiraceae bacterium]|nr:DUF1016 domain-containing protein [Lachnospiraceae bacterium]